MLLQQKFAQLLKAHWTEILDQTQVMKMVLEQVRSTDFPTLRSAKAYHKQTIVAVTHFEVEGDGFVIWIEFQTPKDEGVVIGTQVYSLRLNGEIHLQENHGTYFLSETS